MTEKFELNGREHAELLSDKLATEQERDAFKAQLAAAEYRRCAAENRAHGFELRLSTLLASPPVAVSERLTAMTADRDKWLEAFNRSEQFQDGPTKRAEKAEALVFFYEQHTAKQANELVTTRLENKALRNAVSLAEAVYKMNCVAPGEPSSILAALRDALAQ